MEKITKSNGKWFYGERECRDVDDLYGLFRNEYHNSIGKAVRLRLNRIGYRKERVHGFGFVFSEQPRVHKKYRRVGYRMLGLVDVCYCRMIAVSDVNCDNEEEFDEWFDYAFSQGSGALRLEGRNEKTGRTAKKRRETIK